MSIKKKVSIKNAVFNLIDDIGGQDHKLVPVLTRWATDADIAIKSAYAYKPQNFVLTAEGCKLELPCCIVFLHAVLAGDHGCDCDVLFDRVYNRLGIAKINPDSSGNFLVVDVGSDFNISRIGGRIINNVLWFNKDVNGKKFTIKTQSYFTDEEGFIMINENHVTAITAYLEWKLAKRTRWNKKLGSITEQGIRQLNMDWHTLCKEARADDVDDKAEHDEITEMYNNPMTGGQSGFFLY